MDELFISCIQFDINWEDKAGNIQKIEDLLSEASSDSDVIVLPEMFTTGFSMNPGPFAELMTGETVKWMIEKSSELDAVVTGSLMIEEFGKYRNRLLWVKPDGSISYYDKRHPFCLINEGKYFIRGEQRGLFTWKGWRVMPSICYDLRFPVWLRNDIAYDILLNVANWPSVRSFSWKQFASARAMENQSYTVVVNRVGKDDSQMNFTGDSRIISFDGKSIVEARENETTIISAVLSKTKLENYRLKYPFLIDKEDFTIKV